MKANITPVKNEGYEQTAEALREKGYFRLDEFKRARIAGCIVPEVRFEVWAGAKGTLILQVWKPESGVTVYCNWALGYTFDEMKAAL